MQLPDPESKAGADVVIWDGKCRFCRQQVERLARFDFWGKLAYLSLHDPRTQSLCPNLSFQELMDQLWVVTSDGRQFGGADAGRYLSRKLPGLWWLAPLLHVPFSMPLWRWIYAKIAAQRYRLAGIQCDDQGTCDLHHSQ